MAAVVIGAHGDLFSVMFRGSRMIGACEGDHWAACPSGRPPIVEMFPKLLT
jgi:hypothetical protein